MELIFFSVILLGACAFVLGRVGAWPVPLLAAAFGALCLVELWVPGETLGLGFLHGNQVFGDAIFFFFIILPSTFAVAFGGSLGWFLQREKRRALTELP